MRIRRALASDWPEIAALLAELGLPVAGAEEHLAHFVVAQSEAGNVVAAAGLEVYGADALLRSVAVRRDLHGSGIGRALTEALIEMARSQGLRTLTLLTTTAADYFPRFGFERVTPDEVPEAVRQSAEFQGACPSSAVVMVPRLPA